MNFDGHVDIATAKHFSEPYVTKSVLWSELVSRLSKSIKTNETHAEYTAMEKPQRDKIKDVGGFVGGRLNGTRRLKNAVVYRQLVTLDIDNGVPGQWEDFINIFDCAACLYSTHSHSDATPSYRLVIPVDRPMNADEFEAVSRKLAFVLDFRHFCKTSFVRHQVMFWASHCRDIQPVFETQDGSWLNVDGVLATYRNWADITEWKGVDYERPDSGKAQQDPTEKRGIIGAFCRAYDIEDAIENFVPDYIKSDIPDRYTYSKGTTANGVVTYDGKFSYSHHSSDPASERLCNAFDLVRLHLFGHLDEGTKEKQPFKLPSYVEMERMLLKDDTTKEQLGKDKIESAAADFADVVLNNIFDGDGATDVPKPETIKAGNDGTPIADADTAWLAKLTYDKKSNIEKTRRNIVLILLNDKNLKGCFHFNAFAMREHITKNLPWRKVTAVSDFLTDRDMASLREYFESVWTMDNEKKIQDGLDVVLNRNSFHPVRDYLKNLKWDGVKRLETLYVDYLGASDSMYTRTVTRKALVACVARVFQPGIKFDNMTVFYGAQGRGKSWLIGKLGGKWFSESLGNIHTKEALENIQGAWIIEVGEMSQFRKAEVEAVKDFVSKRFDKFRGAYLRKPEVYFRQCVFFGTTNNRDFLKDVTGNRRFWTIDVMHGKPRFDIFTELTDGIVEQVWAEAFALYCDGEELQLDRETAIEAEYVQAEYTERDERESVIMNYLEMLLPDDWDNRSIYQRQSFIQGFDEETKKGTVQRQTVSIPEIWCELMKKDKAEMNHGNTKYIHNILRRLESWTEIKPFRDTLYGTVRGYARKPKTGEILVTPSGISDGSCSDLM